MKKFIAALSIAMVLCSSGLFANGQGEASSASASAAPSGEWPTKNVTVVVPAAAGSQLDLLARIACTYLQKTTGKAFVVQNDVTGNGTVAYENVRNAAKDGSTILMTQNIFLQYYGGVYNTNPWDAYDVVATLQDLNEAYVLAAKAGRSEFNDWDSFVAYCKANPGKVVAGIQNGGMAHMLTAMLAKEAGIEFKMVEAGSSADKISGILGGYIDTAFVATGTANGYVESGDLIAFMTTTPGKSEYNKSWPTSAELGYPDIINLSQFAVYVPKGTDPQIIERMNSLIQKMAGDADVQAQNAKLKASYTPRGVQDSIDVLKKNEESIKAGYALIK